MTTLSKCLKGILKYEVEEYRGSKIQKGNLFSYYRNCAFSALKGCFKLILQCLQEKQYACFMKIKTYCMIFF